MQEKLTYVEHVVQKSQEQEKCRKCACMHETLNDLDRALTNNKIEGTEHLLELVHISIQQKEPAAYT